MSRDVRTANDLARSLAFHVETGLTQARMIKAAEERAEDWRDYAEYVKDHLASVIEQYEEIRQKIAAVESAPQVTNYCPNCEARGRNLEGR